MSEISLSQYENSEHSKQFQKKEQILHKVQIFTLTFLAYTSVHALRTTYSFSKSYLPDQIGVQQKYIGLVDSVMLLFLGLGNFLIAIYQFPKPITILWIAMIACSIEYCFVPISMNYLTGTSAFITLLILMAISGFIQSFTWPNLLTLIHTVATPEKDGALLGFWATNGNVGNIFGFAISQYFVLSLDLNWQYSLLIAALFMFIIGILIAIRVQEIPEKMVPLDPLIEKDQQQSFPSLTQLYTSPKLAFLAISFALLKSVMYGILLWLPVYFHTIGLTEYQLYIPMTFDASSIFGSMLLGALFKRLKRENKNSAMLPFLILLIIFFILLKQIDFTVVGYFVIIGCVGFCLGGTYNTMTSLVTMQLVSTIPLQQQSKYLRFYSATLMAIGYFITAITQTIIGLTVAENQSLLFTIFLIYTLMNLFSMIIVVYIDHNYTDSHQQESQTIENKNQQTYSSKLILQMTQQYEQ